MPATSSAAARSCSIAAASSPRLRQRAVGGVALHLGEREQQVLGVDLLGAEAPRDALRAHDDGAALAGEALQHRSVRRARRAPSGAWRASCERLGG
jgi:hypothetical protein